MIRTVKPRTLKVISVCSVCGEPVNTNKEKASRHGFIRYRKRRPVRGIKFVPGNIFSQEDDRPCAGSGKEVIYKRFKK